MRKVIIIAGALALTACGFEGGDTTPLTDAELQARAPAYKIDFGNDSSEWSNDGECDDPRFRGPGMTTTPLLPEDVRADRSDCLEAYQRGELVLAG